MWFFVFVIVFAIGYGIKVSYDKLKPRQHKQFHEMTLAEIRQYNEAKEKARKR